METSLYSAVGGKDEDGEPITQDLYFIDIQTRSPALMERLVEKITDIMDDFDVEAHKLYKQDKADGGLMVDLEDEDDHLR